jgi:transposase
VALRVVHLLPLGIRSIHSNTTSIALCGTYNWTASDEQFAEEHPHRCLLRITYGYSKGNHPDLKQFTYGLAVSAEGLPLIGEVRDGSLSNKVHRDAIRQSFLGS